MFCIFAQMIRLSDIRLYFMFDLTHMVKRFKFADNKRLRSMRGDNTMREIGFTKEKGVYIHVSIYSPVS